MSLEGDSPRGASQSAADSGKPRRPKTVVTGGCGFIGAHLVAALLATGRDITVVDMRTPELLDELTMPFGRGNLDVHILDIADSDGLDRVFAERRPDEVVHLAGVLSDGCDRSPRVGAVVNLGGMAGILELAARYRVARLVWSSSVSVFGYVASDSTIADDATHAPTSFYGLYKSTSEAQARLFYKRDGISSTGIRVGFCYGYGRSTGRGSWVRELFEKPVRGLPARVRGGDALVPWQHVSDAAAAFVAALDVPEEGAHVYNTAGEARWKHEAVAIIRDLLPDCEIKLEGESEGYPTGLDDHLFRERFRWRPRVALEEGVRLTLDGYRRNAEAEALQTGNDTQATA